ncbi:MAG: hypothetical protein K9N06_13145 [Candidatus Cloacimonetes bacterium]|nr:hypothetical protein [Candidatus Cloacimonadota bacterium]
MEKVVNRKKITEQSSDRAYWLSRSCQERIDALEEIRTEYNTWRYNDKQRFQRVYTITKRKQG